MRTPTWLAYAEQSSNPDAIFYEQQTFLEAFLKQVTTDRTRPTSVLFRTDDDGVIRTWPDRPPNLPPLLPHALTPVADAPADFQGTIRILVPATATPEQDEPDYTTLPTHTLQHR